MEDEYPMKGKAKEAHSTLLTEIKNSSIEKARRIMQSLIVSIKIEVASRISRAPDAEIKKFVRKTDPSSVGKKLTVEDTNYLRTVMIAHTIKDSDEDRIIERSFFDKDLLREHIEELRRQEAEDTDSPPIVSMPNSVGSA